MIATHMALRYLPTAHDVPFWALSSIGGADTVIGGAQPLRGYGDGRFYDRDSFSSSVEFRRNVATVPRGRDLGGIGAGSVHRRGPGFRPHEHAALRSAAQGGWLGISRHRAPFVVGYVDIGYGSEGAAVFTGLNYPF